jgi:hypothetical protein
MHSKKSTLKFMRVPVLDQRKAQGCFPACSFITLTENESS